VVCWVAAAKAAEGSKQEGRCTASLFGNPLAHYLSTTQVHPQTKYKKIPSMGKKRKAKKRRGNVCGERQKQVPTGVQNSPHLSGGDPRRSHVALVQHLEPSVTHIRSQCLNPRPKRFWTLSLIPRTRRWLKRGRSGPGSPDRSPRFELQ
jgi:hypothetical protein